MTSGPSTAPEVRGAVTEQELDPRYLGGSLAAVEVLTGRDGAYSATLVRALLAEEQESTRDAVPLNVVAGLTAADPTAHGPRLGRLLVGAVLPLLSRIIQTTRSVLIGQGRCGM